MALNAVALHQFGAIEGSVGHFEFASAIANQNDVGGFVADEMHQLFAMLELVLHGLLIRNVECHALGSNANAVLNHAGDVELEISTLAVKIDSVVASHGNFSCLVALHAAL